MFNEKSEISERCKGVHCVDLGESFPTSIYLQNLASIQPRARSADALRQMRRTTRPTRALRAPRDPRRWAQGAPPPGSRDLRLLAVRESPAADAAWVHHVPDAGHVGPVRPLALGAGRAVAWPAAHATVRVPCPTPRRSSVVS